MEARDPPSAPPRTRSRRAAVAGGLIGAAAVGAAALPLLLVAYGWGKHRGSSLERERARVREAVVCPADAPDTSLRAEAVGRNHAGGTARHAASAQEEQTADTAQTADARAPTRRAIALHALDCVRLTWPMELLARSETVDHPHIRLREIGRAHV